MFSFEGDYKRTPSQSLGGVSHNNDRETLIKRAQQERQKRAEMRKQHMGALIIQSYVRSFLTRSKVKDRERIAFDRYMQSTGLTNLEQLDYLMQRILFFYYSRNQRDGERLVCIQLRCNSYYFLFERSVYLLFFNLDCVRTIFDQRSGTTN